MKTIVLPPPLVGTREGMLLAMRSFLGEEETPHGSNLQPFAAIAGHKNGEAWCDTCVVAAAKLAGVKGVPNSASCQASVDAYKRDGRLHDEPQRGDQEFIWFPKLKRYAHTGVVEAVEGDVVIPIEGNTDAKGGRTGGKVMRQRRTWTHGMVFGRPLYVPTPKKVLVQGTPTLRPGDGPSQAIKNIQTALNRRGNKLKLTGRMDKATVACVRLFKSRHHLGGLPDVVDAGVWAELRKP